MQRPDVRIIEPQQEQSSPADVTSSEAAYILAKYGYTSPPQSTTHNTVGNDLTLEEMITQQQRENESQRQIEYQRKYGPKAITFDNNQIRYTNSEFRDLDIDGQNFGIQIQVVSDMPIQNRG
jgi:hypothetical protein